MLVSGLGQTTCITGSDVCTGINVSPEYPPQAPASIFDMGYGSGGGSGIGLPGIPNLGLPTFPLGFSFASLLIMGVVAYIVVKKVL